MAFFTCSFWWFLLGLLVGWLLNWLLWRVIRRDPPPTRSYGIAAPARPASPPAPPPLPVVPLAPVSAPVPPPPPPIDLAAAAVAGFKLKSADDLTIVEGIGPKICALLQAAGIATFADLARTDVTEITAILERGGTHFNLANPVTWPEQAALAASNRWGDLKTLQDELDGGVRREDGNATP